MDRIADSGSVGWGFESLRGHLKPLKSLSFWRFYFFVRQGISLKFYSKNYVSEAPRSGSKDNENIKFLTFT